MSFLKQALWNLTSLTPKHCLGSNLSLPYITASLICRWLRQPYPTRNKNGFLDIYVYLTATILSSFNRRAQSRCEPSPCVSMHTASELLGLLSILHRAVAVLGEVQPLSAALKSTEMNQNLLWYALQRSWKTNPVCLDKQKCNHLFE